MYKLSSTQSKEQGRRLKGVDLRLVVGYLKCALRFIAEHPEGPLPIVVEGFRTAETQAAYFAQGRTTPGEIVTQKPPGHSLHELRPARALDIGFLDIAGQPVFTRDNYEEFYGFWLEHSPTIEWGGLWKSPVDCPHFQVQPLV